MSDATRLPTILSALALTMAMAVCPAVAQETPETSVLAGDDVLTVRAATGLRVPVDGAIRVPVSLDISGDYHTMANPASEAFYEPTALQVPEDAEAPVAVSVAYPAGADYDLLGDTIKVYGGRVSLLLGLVAPPDAAPGEAMVPLELSYQACSESQCLPPATLRFELPIEIVPAGTTVPYAVAPEDVAPATAEATGQGGAEDDKLTAALKRGFLFALLVTYGAGLALNLTPCVFPLLPVTMGFFAGQGEHRVSRTLPMAAVYVLALAAVFTVMGVIAALAGSLIGAVLSSFLGRAIIAAVLLTMAVSLFGAFEIRVPSRWVSGAQGKVGLAGAAAMGGVLGLVAAPCVGPFVISLIAYVAKTGDVVKGGGLFFTLAIGMGTPYLFLGMFTGLINKVPRGGGWLIWFRRVLAFPLLALVVYFMKSDMPYWLVWALYAAIALVGAVYLGMVEGWSRRPWSDRFVVARVAVAMLFTGAATWIAATEALPALGLVDRGLGVPLAWEAYEAGDLDAGEPTVVYVTAGWCSACNVMNRKVFRGEAVGEASRGVRLLKIDVTNGVPPGEPGELVAEYASAGPPVLAFYDASGELVARREGKLDQTEFIAYLGRISGSDHK